MGRKIGIVACSNALQEAQEEQISKLNQILLHKNITPVFSGCIYAKDSVFSGKAQERAEAVMEFYQREDIEAIFDISGGDLANEVIPYLDFERIAASNKMFWGYSDLTTIINAIYAKTGKESCLYQLRNLIRGAGELQQTWFDAPELYNIQYKFVQGKAMRGVIVGGNIRCLLKLAGTEYWPDMKEKILLLEARGGKVPQMVTYLSQLKQMGVFQQIAGILLGTFTEMEEYQCEPDIVELVKMCAGTDMPIAKTGEIGHSDDSKAIIIGKEAAF